jgi:hypothetical protein
MLMCTLMWNELVIRLAWGYHMVELYTFDLSCINLVGAVHHSGEETRMPIALPSFSLHALLFLRFAFVMHIAEISLTRCETNNQSINQYFYFLDTCNFFFILSLFPLFSIVYSSWKFCFSTTQDTIHIFPHKLVSHVLLNVKEFSINIFAMPCCVILIPFYVKEWTNKPI